MALEGKISAITATAFCFRTLQPAMFVMITVGKSQARHVAIGLLFENRVTSVELS